MQCVVFCGSMLVFLAIELSALWFTAPDYPCGIIKICIEYTSPSEEIGVICLCKSTWHTIVVMTASLSEEMPTLFNRLSNLVDKSQ